MQIHSELEYMSGDERHDEGLIVAENALLFFEELAEEVDDADEANQFNFGFDAIVVDVEQPELLVEKCLGFDLDVHAFVSLFEVAKIDDLAQFWFWRTYLEA